MFVSIGHDGFLGLVVKFFVASALLSLYSLPHSDAFFFFFLWRPPPFLPLLFLAIKDKPSL